MSADVATVPRNMKEQEEQEEQSKYEVAEHPRMKAERERVKSMSEITEYRPEDSMNTERFCLTDVTTGMVGRSKDVRGTMVIGRTVGGSSTTGFFGQDAAFSDVLRVEGEEGLTAAVGIIADGHGAMGEDVSKWCIDFMRKEFLTPARLRTLLDLLVVGNSEAVRVEIRACFHALDKRVCDAVELGGATLTVWVVLQDNRTGRIFVVTSNVGDSPLLLIQTSCGRVGEMTTRHSWDSIQERRVHNKACIEAGVPIPEVIYARWNTEDRQTIPDPQGRFSPIRMFKGSTDEIDEVNRDHVVKMVRAMGKRPGGVQSRIRKLQRIRRRGSSEWEDDVLEGTGHENYGSTPLEFDERRGVMDGGPQMTRSIGDRRYKGNKGSTRVPYMTAAPSVSILECWGATHFALVGFSDGPGDALYSSEFGELTQTYFEKHVGGNAQGLADHLMESVQREGSFFFGTPRWDDLSMVCTTFCVGR